MNQEDMNRLVSVAKAFIMLCVGCVAIWALWKAL